MMKKFYQASAGLVFGFALFAFSSCAYDPYYSGSSYSNYGDGYGYGNSSFSTSTFISTGNSRWGYDPRAGAYYDYNRRAYYDPYLSGYYPVGYRPQYVSGAPHPGGWSRGRDYCPPPSRVRGYNLKNYRDRGERYQGLGRNWSKNVRTRGDRFESRDRFDRFDKDRRSPFLRRYGDDRSDVYRKQSRDQRREYGRSRDDGQRRDFGRDRSDRQRRDSDNARGRDRGSSDFDRNRSVNTRRENSRREAAPQRRAEKKNAPQGQKRASGTRAERFAAQQAARNGS